MPIVPENVPIVEEDGSTQIITENNSGNKIIITEGSFPSNPPGIPSNFGGIPVTFILAKG